MYFALRTKAEFQYQSLPIFSLLYEVSVFLLASLQAKTST